jgi:hypothetical protein
MTRNTKEKPTYLGVPWSKKISYDIGTERHTIDEAVHDACNEVYESYEGYDRTTTIYVLRLVDIDRFRPLPAKYATKKGKIVEVSPPRVGNITCLGNRELLNPRKRYGSVVFYDFSADDSWRQNFYDLEIYDDFNSLYSKLLPMELPNGATGKVFTGLCGLIVAEGKFKDMEQKIK